MATANTDTLDYGSVNDKQEKRRSNPLDTLTQLIEWASLPNVAEEIDKEKLGLIGQRVVREYNIDENSRKEWLDKAKQALERSKLKSAKKSWPFDDAANVKYPLLTIAALQFSARAYAAIIDGIRIVKGQVVGDDPDGSKRSKADRVGRHMSWQLLTEMPEWEEDTDTLLAQIPIIGCAFRKVFRNQVDQRNSSEMVSALDLCVNQNAKSMDTVPRITQYFTLYPHEIMDRKEEGLFLDVDLGMAPDAGEDDDAPHVFLEQHRYLDLNNDGFREPWIVTVHKETEQVVKIAANYDPEELELKIKDEGRAKVKLGRVKRYNTFVKYPFFRDPEGGFYDLGFGELLESISEVVDTTINQMMDAGTLQNAGGGFIGSGLQLKKSQLRFQPGQYHVVNSPGMAIREAIYNVEHPGPSKVSYDLLGMILEAGNKITSTSEIMSGEMPRNQPATTTLAMIEQGQKLYTSIYKRIYRSLKREYELLFDLNARFLDEQSYFTVMDNPEAIRRDDYERASMDVVPVADPTMVTDMQRMMRGQAIMEAAKDPSAEGIVNRREAYSRFFDTIGVEKAEELLMPEQQGPNPQEELAMRGMAAEVAGKDADAKKKEAEAQKAQTEAGKNVAETEAVQSETASQNMADAQQFEADLQKQFDGLMQEEPEEEAA